MIFDVLTLFPEIIQSYCDVSIMKRARESGIFNVNTVNPRDYTLDKHKKVDDTPYGGGAGMVLMCQPIFDCIESIKTDNSVVIMMTPEGKSFNQNMAKEFLNIKHLILLCGHYEGFDERIKNIVDLEVSIGDFILTGGEIPAMAITDSVVRLIDGVINKDS